MASNPSEFSTFLEKSKTNFMENWLKPTVESGSLSDFDILKTIGAGAFGVVVLVKHRNASTIHAMKILEKREISKTKQVQHVKNEVKVMNSINFEFLLKSEFFFKNNVYLFIGMPFVNGGELIKRIYNTEHEII